MSNYNKTGDGDTIVLYVGFFLFLIVVSLPLALVIELSRRLAE